MWYTLRTRPLDWLIFLIWISNPLLDYLHIVLMHLPIINMFSDIVIPTIFVLLILISANCLKSTIHVTDILFYIVCVMTLVFYYMFYTNNIMYIDEYVNGFIWAVLPVYFVGVSMTNLKRLFPYLEILSFIVIFCYFIFKNYVSVDHNLVAAGGDMSGAYALLPHLLFVSWRALNRKGWSRIIIPLGTFMILFILGNRGSLLCYMLFLFVYLFVVKKNYKRPVVCVCYIVLLVGVIAFFKTIMIGLSSYLNYDYDNYF